LYIFFKNIHVCFSLKGNNSNYILATLLDLSPFYYRAQSNIFFSKRKWILSITMFQLVLRKHISYKYCWTYSRPEYSCNTTRWTLSNNQSIAKQSELPEIYLIIAITTRYKSHSETLMIVKCLRGLQSTEQYFFSKRKWNLFITTLYYEKLVGILLFVHIFQKYTFLLLIKGK
jgi:hypothetical protein